MNPASAVKPYDPQDFIDQIANGAFLKDLAAQCGIPKQRLSEQLRKHPDYQQAKETSVEVQLDDAQIAIQQAAEVSDIARAREQFRAAAWRAEREFPHRWGQKSEHTVNVVDWTSELRAAKERVIQGEAAVIHSDPEPKALQHAQEIGSIPASD